MSIVALAVALAALWLAGYAVFVVSRIEAAVAEFIEAASDEDEEEESASEDEREKRHLWVSDGELYVPDMPAFVEEIGALAVYTYDGCPQAVIPGKGVISLHKLLSESTKQDAAKVRAIKP